MGGVSSSTDRNGLGMFIVKEKKKKGQGERSKTRRLADVVKGAD